MSTYSITLYDMIKKGSDTYGDSILFSFMRDGQIKNVSSTEFLKDVQKVAYCFAERNIAGKYVMVEGQSQYEAVVAMSAAITVGAVAAVINFDLPESELDYAAERLQPAMVICSEDNFELAEKYIAEKSHRCMFDSEEGYDQTIANWIENRNELYEYPGTQKPEDPALVLMTSGSTSRSKLVLLSHSTFLPSFELYTEKNMLLFPLYHVAGIAVLAGSILQGVRLCLTNMKRGLTDMEWFRPSSIVAVPAITSCVADRAKKELLDISELKHITNTGAAQNLELTLYLESLGISAPSAYGATEIGGPITYSMSGYHKYGSVGKPRPWNEVRIAENGEILVKGENVMLEYIGAPKETQEALKDGWYHSGDLGRLDEDGYLYITGRIKNVIILSNGENVSPEAIEEQLYLCPEITEVLVYGEDDVLAAHIWCGENADDQIKKTIETFIKKYNRSVPSYRCIRKTVFRDKPFNKSGSGKIKREYR